MASFIRKLIKIIPGVLGVAQVLIPLVRELIIVVIRIIGVLRDEFAVEDTIDKVRSVFDTIEKYYEMFKNFFLGNGD